MIKSKVLSFNFKRYFLVLMVGSMGAIIQITVFNILRHFFVVGVSNTVAVECAIISNFILNNHFSFRDRKFERHAGFSFLLKKFIKFNFFSFGSLILQVVIVSVGVKLFASGFWVENLLVIGGIGLASILNYFIYSRLIWKI